MKTTPRTTNQNATSPVIGATTTYLGEALEGRAGCQFVIAKIVRGQHGDQNHLIDDERTLTRLGGVKAGDRLRVARIYDNGTTSADSMLHYERPAEEFEMFAHLHATDESR